MPAADSNAPRQAVVGLLAHVDAGKTTLAEALLFEAGEIRSTGRVDHGDAQLDFEPVERDRGITVFSKQMHLDHGGTHLMFLDAPGHVDFCAEAERTLQVLDLAVLVVGANDGVQGHTKTLWRLLARHQVPTVVFVNKMDLAGSHKADVLDQLVHRLDARCVDYGNVSDPTVQETLAMADEQALEEYVESGCLSPRTVRALVLRRLVFPSLFGSALRQEGIRQLLDVVADLAPARQWPTEFSARVYKVSHGQRHERISWLKVTGGSLVAKAQLEGVTAAGVPWSEKADQVRVYQGQRFEVVSSVPAGRVCALTGLSQVIPGDGLGRDAESTKTVAGSSPRITPQETPDKNVRTPLVSPVLDYCVEPHNSDAHALYQALRELSDEDPLLAATWSEELQEVHVRLMGEVQQEVVQRLLEERYGLVVGFGAGSILYNETICDTVTGIGHFEPLRHYAEVHLRIEPLPRGGGLEFGTCCSEDDLDRNWQRLILTNALERTHRGVLVGAPLTDVRITLLAGRAHAKHTEGGDFRQATYRAIRQGLMQARSMLLEPWYRFELEVPQDKVGRALADLPRMSARFDAPQISGDTARITGEAPVSEMRGYSVSVSSYTSGHGQLFLEYAGYDTCHDADEVMQQAAYDPRADLPHTPDSVFCSHGAGYTVPWDQVPAHAHVAPNTAHLRPWRAANADFFGIGT